MPASRRVVIVAFPGVALLDVTGPAEVFSVASGISGTDRPGYRVEIAAARTGELPTSRKGLVAAGAVVARSEA